MKLIIEGTEKEIQNTLQAMSGSKERAVEIIKKMEHYLAVKNSSTENDEYTQQMNNLLASDVEQIEVGIIDQKGDKQEPIVLMDQRDAELSGHAYISVIYSDDVKRKDFITERMSFKKHQ